MDLLASTFIHARAALRSRLPYFFAPSIAFSIRDKPPDLSIRRSGGVRRERRTGLSAAIKVMPRRVVLNQHRKATSAPSVPRSNRFGGPQTDDVLGAIRLKSLPASASQSPVSAVDGYRNPRNASSCRSPPRDGLPLLIGLDCKDCLSRWSLSLPICRGG